MSHIYSENNRAKQIFTLATATVKCYIVAIYVAFSFLSFPSEHFKYYTSIYKKGETRCPSESGGVKTQ